MGSLMAERRFREFSHQKVGQKANHSWDSLWNAPWDIMDYNGRQTHHRMFRVIQIRLGTSRNLDIK